jgi:hypothetical protein
MHDPSKVIGLAICPTVPAVDAEADVNQALTFDCPTIGCCCTSSSNAFKVIALGHRKSAGWVKLTLASTVNG